MPLMIEDLKNNKLYNKQLFLPINTDNKRKGSLIYLLSPSMEESVRLMGQEANSYFKNPNLFYSYYMEKDINLIIHEGCKLYNEDRDVVHEDMSLYKYYRFTTDSPEVWKEVSGKDMDYGQTAIAFRDANDYIVGYVIVSGATIMDAWSISKQLDKELMKFTVDVLQCRNGHTKLGDKYKAILRNKYETKTIDKAVIVISTISESAPLLEGIGNTVLKAEIAMWQAQAKITEDIIRNHDNSNWMKTQYKSMKAKLNKIPLPGYDSKIDDTIDSLRNELDSQRATISFMISMAELELKDEVDLKNITDDYVSWIKATKCSKKLKLKLIRQLKESYKDTIEIYKNNIARYERQSAVEKRVENATAIISKVFSAFSFLSSGPLSCLKGLVLKSILPQSKKVNILSVDEMRTKIEMYEKLVEQLEEMEQDIQLNESVLAELYSLTKFSDNHKSKPTPKYKKIPLTTDLVNDIIKSSDKDTLAKTHLKFEKSDVGELFVHSVTEVNMGYWVVDKDKEWITAIEVMPKYKGMGLGNELLKAAMNAGGKYLTVNAKNDVAIHMYKKAGFEEMGGRGLTTYMKLRGEPDYVLKEDYVPKGSIDVIKSYGFTDDDGEYNSCVVTNKSEKPLRARAEVLIFKGDTIYMDYIDEFGNMRLPGGTLNKGDSYEAAAKREGQEESRITAKNFKRYNHRVFIRDMPKAWVMEKEKPEDWWYGEYSVTFVAEYDKKYTGYIAPIDQDDMVKTAKFYKIADVYDKCNDYFKGAIDMYLKDHPKVMSESFLQELFTNSSTNISYFNTEDFVSGKSNVCLVTGLSGSGKSTTAKRLAKEYDAKYIELDIFGFAAHKINQKDYPIEYRYLKANPQLAAKLKENRRMIKWDHDEFVTETSNFINYVLDYCRSDRNNKYVIEGVQIYLSMQPERLANVPIIIIHSGVPTAMNRMYKREISGSEYPVQKTIKSIHNFPNTLSGYLSENEQLHEFLNGMRSISTPMNTMVDEFTMIKPLWHRDNVLTESTYIRDYDSITYYESTLNEDTIYDAKLKKILYSERLRNQKEVIMYYSSIKAACPEIRNAYSDIARYKGLNLFVGCEYYIERFMAGNKTKLDKSIDLAYDFFNRLINDKRFGEAGYKKTTVFIPVTGWGAEKDSNFWDYKEFTNPMSIIYRLLMRGDTARLQAWKGVTFLFIGRNGYFKLDAGELEKKHLPLFKKNIQKLLDNTYIDCSDEPDNSTTAIIADVISNIEDPDGFGADKNSQFSTHITINALTGAEKDLTPAEIKEKEAKAASTSEDEEEDGAGLDPKQEEIRKKKTKELLDKVESTAAHSADSADAMDKLMQDEEFKKIIDDLKMASPNTVNYSSTRVARINNIKADFAKVKYNDKTLGDLVLSDAYDDKPIQETSIPVDSTNEEWQHLVGANIAKSYNVNDDIYRMIYHFADCKVPVAPRDIKIEDTSTSEDTVDTWTISCEDINGKRFTLKFDVPKIINNRFMRLRGNDKVMSNQLMNLPIIKTGLNTTQITSNYNKIFLSPYGSSTGKSFVTADRMMKALGKYTGKNIKYVVGDNSRICNKYDLPLDYIDIASNYTSITFKDGDRTYNLIFNQDTIREKFKKKLDSERLCIGWTIKSGEEKPLYADASDLTISSNIALLLCMDKEFKEIYDSTSVSTKYTYSMASIMSSQIPVAVLIGYAIGLTPMLDRAKVKYKVLDKRGKYDKSTHDIIKFNDAIVEYELDYASSMLLNGLKACDTASYSIKEANSSGMWLDFLDQFGGRIKSDGLDMFYDLMFDPLTRIACRKYKLPDNYIDGLLYANILLSDNKYNKHTDITGNRYRNNEIIAAYVYKAMANSYSMYRRSLKIGRDAIMSMKQSAVIDLILADNTESDYSYLSPLLEFESANTTSFQGLSGMNAKRAYSLDKRIYDSSMVNVLSMSTGFAGTVGITRQTTIDPNINSQRGYINSNPDKMSITKTFCMTEALTPYGVTCDDPFRTAMTFIQTNKHGMRTAISDPLLVTTGADEALVYLTSDTFSHKAKGKGKIKEVTKDYMVIEYNETIKTGVDGDAKFEVIDLREHAMKNSDGGFYQMVKLDTDYKVGDIVRKDDVVAIDKLSYSDSVGPKDNYAYDIGTMVKFCVLETDEGFEDSCRSTEWLSKALSSEVCKEHQYNFNKDTNIYHIVKPGDPIQEGDPVIVFQNAFDDEDANALIRALKTEDEDVVEELGRITLKSKVTGVVKDVQVRRCVEIEECSPTMQKVIKDYEKRISVINKAYAKYDKSKLKTAEPNYKLEPTGRLKNSVDSVLISIYISYQDDFGISDKVVCYSALKGVSSKEIIPAGMEARSSFRKDEKIHYIQSQNGDMKRMVGSVFKIGALNKVLIELHRAMCEDVGVKWYYLDEYPGNNI